MPSQPKPLSVAFLTKWDPLDPHSWSGTMKSMYSSLERAGAHLMALGPVRSGARMALRGGDMLAQALLGKSYDYRHSLLVAKEYAFRFERKLSEGDFDVIFAPVASTEISLLKTDTPIVYLTDILFPDYVDYYPQCSRLLRFSAAEVDKIEALAMRKATAFICPSDWVKNRASKAYGLPVDRIHMLPFGANLERTPSYEEATERRDLEVCRLLFLGVDWRRKGGPIAVEVLRLLTDAGLPVELTICGCVPPDGISHPRMKIIPFLSKRDPVQTKELYRLMRQSTFLLLPTQADASPIVLCEACAFGLPPIVRNTGGVSGIVQDGVNGYAIDPHAGPEAYAKMIAELFTDRERYDALSVSSRQAYDRRLNWDAWGRDARHVLESVSKRHQAEGSLFG